MGLYPPDFFIVYNAAMEITLFTLLLCPKWYLRNEACEFPFVIIIQWTQQYLGYISWPSCSPPLLCLHSESKVLSMSASVFAIVYSHQSILFPVNNVLWCLVWPFWLNLSKCGSATATWQMTGDRPNLLSILVTISFLMKFCNWLSNYKCYLCRHLGLRMSTKC